MTQLEYHPAAVDDMRRAIDYLESEARLGQALRSEVMESLDRIADNPRLYRADTQGVRRCPLRRFPFSIYFRILDEDLVRILVIRHHRQNPAFGSERQ